ncbi:MAG TPA: nucleotidyltransferase domain-containing protein [Bacteroidales bacterium]|jgi:predicted nucleotidyltransferase|nr:nucleotidyltransferase domain-containing protein [Bacteroidales bacterium]
MRTDAILDSITKTIHSKDPSAQAYLFGSRARGDNRPDSDWDILILVNDQFVTNEIDDKFRNDLYKIEVESGQIISILIYPKDYWKNTLKITPLYKTIIKEGVKL